MPEKVKFELEYLLKTSPKILENMIKTPSGLSEWYADDVNIHNDIFTFIWDGSEEKARLLPTKNNNLVRFKRMEDEEAGYDYYFEMGYEIDPMTKSVVLKISDYADSDELSESKMLWEQQISDLKRVIGN